MQQILVLFHIFCLRIYPIIDIWFDWRSKGKFQMHFFKFNLMYSLEMQNDTFKCENFKCFDSNAFDYSCITWLMFTTRYTFFCSCIMGVRTSENRNKIVIIRWYQIQTKPKYIFDATIKRTIYHTNSRYSVCTLFVEDISSSQASCVWLNKEILQKRIDQTLITE